MKYKVVCFVVGTGRSVPSTPLQVSPQGEQIGGESSAEVAPSVEEQMSETSNSQAQGNGKILMLSYPYSLAATLSN